YIKLNDLNVPLELRRDQVNDFIPTIEEGEVIDEPMIDIIKTRNNESFDDSAVVETIDGYQDQDIGDIILGEPFCKASRVEARRFDGLITIHNGSDNVTYQMARSHPKFKHLSNAQCNKIKPLLKVSMHDKLNGISHPYQKLKVIIEYLVKIGKKERILELKRRHLKILTLTSYTPYPSRKIRHSNASISGKECNLEFVVWKQVPYHGDDEVVEDKERPIKRRRVNNDEMYKAANEE
ncbi:hypothetical protein Tco_1196028, partial [Tanacetum coccineum]